MMHPSTHARDRPDAPAIVMGDSGEVVTYRQLDERSNRAAQMLQRRGLGPGDHIAILLDNQPAFLEMAWAAQRSGMYYTAINRHLRAGEVQYILDDCGAQLIVTSSAMASVATGLDLARIPHRLMIGVAVAGFESYESAVGAEQPLPIGNQLEGREMLYSSGTTGKPKGVRKPLPATPIGDEGCAPVIIARNLAAQALEPGSVYLSPAPLYHSAPLVYSMSLHRVGATVVIMEHFDAAACLALIEKYRVTHAQFVPTMFVRLLRLPREERLGYDTSSLRFVVHAAAPCPVAVKREMLEWWGPIIHEYYAGTEDIGSTAITPEEWLAHPGSVGRPLTDVHIVDPDGEEVGAWATGTVYFGGGRPFEYHNDPDKTASIVDRHGWRTLGDVGHVDDEGYLYLTDRQAHMIISGGVNIYPQEAENVLAGHPAVADVAVIGVPDPDMGEAVLAVVQPVDPSAAGADLEAELLAFCQHELATYKCPRSIHFQDALPRDPNGKLYKRLLRDRYWEGHETNVI